jgi:excisionase family DNA binding protein
MEARPITLRSEENEAFEAGDRRSLATLSEAARYLRIARSTLYLKLRSGPIQGAFKVGGQWRVDLDLLQQFLDENTMARR